MYVACCCCAAAADVDLSSSAYPSAALSLLRPQIILPYLHLSPIAGIHGAALEYDVPVCIDTECCCCADAALCVVGVPPAGYPPRTGARQSLEVGLGLATG